MRRTQDQIFTNLYDDQTFLPSSGIRPPTHPLPPQKLNTERAQLTMYLFVFFLLIGLLSTSEVQAAPTSPDVDAATSAHSEPESATNDEVQRAKELDWTMPKESEEKLADRASAREFFYHFRKSLSAMAGPAYRTDAIQDPDTQLSLNYWQHPTDGASLEAGADLMSDGTGALHISKRDNQGRGRLRSYYKYGLAIRIVPNEQLVTFLKFQNWQLRGSAGAEWQWPWGKSWSLRSELGINLSQGRIQIPILIGATTSF